MKMTITLVLLALVAGCGESFLAGVGTGVVAAKKLSDDAQTKFIVAVNDLNAETARLNTEIGAVKELDIKDFIQPETIKAFESVKTEDPMTWITLASVLGAAFFGGKVHEKRKEG